MPEPKFIWVDTNKDLSENQRHAIARRIAETDLDEEERIKLVQEFGVPIETYFKHAENKALDKISKQIVGAVDPKDIYLATEADQEARKFERKLRGDTGTARAVEEQIVGVPTEFGLKDKKSAIRDNVKKFYKSVPNSVMIELFANRDPIRFKRVADATKERGIVGYVTESPSFLGRVIDKGVRNTLVELAQGADTMFEAEKRAFATNDYALDEFIDGYVDDLIENPTEEGLNILKGIGTEVLGTAVEGAAAPFTALSSLYESARTDDPELLEKSRAAQKPLIDSALGGLIKDVAETPASLVSRTRTGEVLEKPVTAAMDAWITGDVVKLARKIMGLGVVGGKGFISKKIADRNIKKRLIAEQEIINMRAKEAAARQLPLDVSSEFTTEMAKASLGKEIVFRDLASGRDLTGVVQHVTKSGNGVSIVTPGGQTLRKNIRDLRISPVTVETRLGLKPKTGAVKQPVSSATGNPVTQMPTPKGPSVAEAGGEAGVGSEVVVKATKKTPATKGKIISKSPKSVLIETADGRKLRRNPKNVQLVEEPGPLLSMTGKQQLTAAKPGPEFAGKEVRFLDRPKYDVPKRTDGGKLNDAGQPASIKNIDNLMKEFEKTQDVTKNMAVLTDSGQVMWYDSALAKDMDDWIVKNVVPEDQIVARGYYDPATKTFYSPKGVVGVRESLKKFPSPNVTNKLTPQTSPFISKSVSTMRRYSDTAQRNAAKITAEAEKATPKQMERIKDAYEGLGWNENRFKRYVASNFGLKEFEQLTKADARRIRKGLGDIKKSNQAGPPEVGIPDPKKPRSVVPGFMELTPSPLAHYESMATKLISSMQSPDMVLKRTGGAIGENLYLLINEADLGYNDDLVSLITMLRNSSAKYTSKDAEVMFHVMNDTVKEAGLAAAVKPAHIKEVQEILRPITDALADLLKIPANKRRKNYITHVFEGLGDQWTETGLPFALKKTSLKYLKPRIGKEGFKTDVYEALNSYVPAALRKVHYNDDMIKEANRLIKLLPKDAAEYGKRLLDYSRGKGTGRTNKVLREMTVAVNSMMKEKFGINSQFEEDFFINLLRGIRGGQYRGGLSFSPGSAFKNLTQNVNTASLVGPARWGKAVNKFFTGEGQRIVKDSKVMLESIPQEIRRNKKIRALLNSFDEYGFKMFEAAEKLNRGVAAIAGYDAAIAEGKSIKEAMRAAREIGRRTQFSFLRSDTPELFRDIGVKSLLTFQRFPVSQAEFVANLGRMAADGNWLPVRNYIASTMTLASVGASLNMDIAQIFGLNNPTDVIPFLDSKDTVDAGPLFNIGRDFLRYLDAKGARNNKEAHKLKEQMSKNIAIFTGVAGIPGLQVKRIVDFIGRAEHDWDVLDTDGRIRYESDFWTELARLGGMMTHRERVLKSMIRENYNRVFDRGQLKRAAMEDLIVAINEGGLPGEWQAILNDYEQESGEAITVGDIRRKVASLKVTDFMRSVSGLPSREQAEVMLEKDETIGLDLAEEEFLKEIMEKLRPKKKKRRGRSFSNSDALDPNIIRILRSRDWRIDLSRPRRK